VSHRFIVERDIPHCSAISSFAIPSEANNTAGFTPPVQI